MSDILSNSWLQSSPSLRKSTLANWQIAKLKTP